MPLAINGIRTRVCKSGFQHQSSSTPDLRDTAAQKSQAALWVVRSRACSQQSLSPSRDCVIPMEPQMRCLRTPINLRCASGASSGAHHKRHLKKIRFTAPHIRQGSITACCCKGITWAQQEHYSSAPSPVSFCWVPVRSLATKDLYTACCR